MAASVAATLAAPAPSSRDAGLYGTFSVTERPTYPNTMEGDQESGAAEPQADGAALSDSFSQLWSDVMGMLVSYF